MRDYTYKQMIDESYGVMRYTGDEASVTIPASYFGKPVTLVNDSLFAHHPEITSVTLPETIVSIGGHVFDGCLQLQEIKLPPHLHDLLQYAFTRCGVTSLIIPDEVELIAPYTFYDCQSLQSITIGRGVRRIYGHAFCGLPALEELWLPQGVKMNDAVLEEIPQAQVHYY